MINKIINTYYINCPCPLPPFVLPWRLFPRKSRFIKRSLLDEVDVVFIIVVDFLVEIFDDDCPCFCQQTFLFTLMDIILLTCEEFSEMSTMRSVFRTGRISPTPSRHSALT